ncbi:MAG: nitrous oxide reductase accessory protein NosL [Nitrospirae bacterium]|nr:nitrous oxide reductase accessory protein NosL [Nitrospirota bacterium]
MKKKPFLMSAITLGVFLSIFMVAEMAFANDALAETLTGPLKPSSKDKCPVCGMLISPFPQWNAQIIFKDGSYAFFDGPKDMFKYYLNVPKYDKLHTQSDISEVYVTEYYSAKVTKALDVTFVTGSDVMGPMGKELVAVSNDKVKTFMADHKGDKGLKFSEVTEADIPGGHMHH